jgi:hypothetical protein
MRPSPARIDAFALLATALMLGAGVALVVRGCIRSDMAGKLRWDAETAQGTGAC